MWRREISRQVREEVIAKLGSSPSKSDLAKYSFERFRADQFLRTGRILMGVVSRAKSAALAGQWSRQPGQYPFYSAFVEGFLYAGYSAAFEHNERLDRNAQADYEQLAYLNWADIVVSDDTRFFARAFNSIWKARRKVLVTTEGFANLLDRLA